MVVGWLLSETQTTLCSSILNFDQIGDPNTHKKILEKWKEMDNDLSRVSMKFRCQINFLDEEIKKRNVRGVEGVSNAVHPRSIFSSKLATQMFIEKSTKMVRDGQCRAACLYEISWTNKLCR